MSRVETIGDATLYLGDCRDVLATLGAVDAVVTDPPYGFGLYGSDIDVGALRDLLSLGATSVAVFGYPELLVQWCIGAIVTPDEWVTWYPTNKPTPRSSGLPRSSEHIAIFGVTPGAASLMRPRVVDQSCATINAGTPRDPLYAREDDVWRDASPGMGFNSHLRYHPNEKPVSVMEKLVHLCSGEGQTVLDAFMGSGTTGVACAKLARKFIGIEIEPKYFDIACKRIEAAYAEPDLFIQAAPQPTQEAML
jgi:site-specific DNA-methyltransferase (adenine-specific)